MKVILKIPAPKPIDYKVKGKTYTEAAEYLLSKPFAACYKSNPSFKQKFGDSGNTTQITLIAKPTITMPVWPGAGKLKGQEKKDWDSMIAALNKHEKKHHSIFETDAKKFKKDTEAEGDVPKGDVPAKMNAFFTKSQENQNKYDKKTNHGEKEGVVLPV